MRIRRTSILIPNAAPRHPLTLPWTARAYSADNRIAERMPPSMYPCMDDGTLMVACHAITRGLEANEFAAAAASGFTPRLGEIAQRKWKTLEMICHSAARMLHDDRAKESPSTSPKPFVFRMLHAVLELQCPSSIVSYAIRAYPHQVHEADCWHRTPLSIAASRKTIYSHVLTELATPDPTTGHSTCARLDEHGRLPLHLAILGGRHFDEGLRALIAAEPRALEARDGAEHLPPFLLAAVGDSSSATLDLVYGLLRASPCVVLQLRMGVEPPSQQRGSLFETATSSRQKQCIHLRVERQFCSLHHWFMFGCILTVWMGWWNAIWNECNAWFRESRQNS